MVAADDLAVERNLLRLAQEGDPEAIATLLNRTLNPQGISAQARVQDDLLHLLIEAPQVPAQEQWVPFIQQGMVTLNSPVIRRIQIYGRQRGQAQMAWQQAIALNPMSTAYNAVAPAYNAAAPPYAAPAHHAPTYNPTAPAIQSPAVQLPTLLQTAVGSNVSGHQVAIGTKILQMTEQGGAVSLSPRPVAPPQARPRPEASFYCRPFPNLLDRQAEMETLTATLKDGQPVEIHGAAGLGKTAVLRSLAYNADLNYVFRDGIIYRVVRTKPLEDLAQSFFDDFYEYEDTIPRKPTELELQMALRGKRALVILDDVMLPSQEVQQLLNTLPSLSFLTATAEQKFWGEGLAVPLAGLPMNDALVLLERALGRELGSEERVEGENLCNLLQGNPLRIVQAATLVREGEPTPQGNRPLAIATVAQQISSAATPEALILKNAARLPETERRMLAALGVLGSTPIGAHHLGTMTAIQNSQPVLNRLIQQGLATTDGVRYTLAGNLVEPLQRMWNLSQWTPSVIRYFQNWTKQHAQVTGSVAQESDTLLRVAELAAENHQWAEVLSLAKQADGSLAASGYWGSWGKLWQMGLNAAQSIGDQGAIAHALHQLGTRALCLDDTFTANSYLNQALQLRQAMGDPLAVAVTQHNLDFLLNPNAAASVTVNGNTAVGQGYTSMTPTVAVAQPNGATAPTVLTPPRQSAPRPVRPVDPQVAENRNNTRAMVALSVFVAAIAGVGVILALNNARNQPNFAVSADRLQFAAQEVNKTSTAQTITLTNNADRPLTLGRIEITGDNAADFQVSENCTQQAIAPDRNCRVQITFTPQAAGDRAADLTIGDRTGNTHRTLSLRGVGRDPNPTAGNAILNFTPGTLDFGDQRLNQKSATRRITVTNGGSAPLTIRSINTTGAAQTEFTGTETCTRGPLNPNDTCTLDLQFQPTQAGGRTANLTIGDGSNNRWNIPLSGNGVSNTAQVPALSISPGQLDFGERAVRSSSGELVLNLTNTGSQALTVNDLKLVGENAGDFAISRNTCQNTALATNGSCQVGLRFTPGDRDYRSANLQVFSNDPSGTENVFLSGFGVPPVVTTVQVEPTSIDFGNVNLDTASSARTVVIRNTGNTEVRIGDVQLEGNQDFVSDRSDRIGTACRNVALAPGESCSFGVIFLPQVAGTRAARINIPSSSGRTVAVVMQGVGAVRQVPSIDVTPNSVSFGTVNVGNTSTPQLVTLRNAGNSALQVGQIGISGNHAVDFNPETADFSGCSNNTLQPGAVCQVRLFFGPTGAGDRTARLTIPNNSPQGAITLPLNGVGNEPLPTPNPNLTLSPPAVDFGQQASGSANSQTVTVGNTGNAALQIGNITVGGDPDFRLDFSSIGVYSCPNTALPPGETCSFEVVFTPQASGRRDAQVTIPSNSAGGTEILSLSGTGSDPTPQP